MSPVTAQATRAAGRPSGTAPAVAPLLADPSYRGFGPVGRRVAERDRDDAAESPGTPAGPSTATLHLVVVLLVASVLSWRRGVYFSGALDPVVVAKAGLGGLALLLALLAFLRSGRRSPLGAGTLLLATAYLVTTVLGAWTGGSLFASAVVAIRVAMVLATVALVMSTYRPESVVRAIVRTFAGAGAVALVTGLPNAGGGRLVGGIPPLTPNELALLFGVVGLDALWHVATLRSRPWHWPLAALCFAVVFLTGSRTALIVLVLAVLVVLLQMRVYPRATFVGLVLAVPVLAWVVVGSDLLRSVLERGGAENITTLSSRTIAWDAALSMDGPWWQTWFGGGLSMKEIPVTGQYWSTQILDSSWVSALVQGGWTGVAIVLVWTLAVGVAVVRAPRAWRPLLAGLFVFVVGRSPLESGMFDATASFIVFVVVALTSQLVAEPRPGRRERAGATRYAGQIFRDGRPVPTAAATTTDG